MKHSEETYAVLGFVFEVAHFEQLLCATSIWKIFSCVNFLWHHTLEIRFKEPWIVQTSQFVHQKSEKK
jgi:hypothetical protein